MSEILCDWCGDRWMRGDQERCVQCQREFDEALTETIFVAVNAPNDLELYTKREDCPEEMTIGVYKLVKKIKRVVRRTVEETEVEIE